VVLITGAGGLGLYRVAGAAKALAFGLGPVPAVVLGMIGAVGSGVMRDVLGARSRLCSATSVSFT
jgi:uncharacterized membrane protein YeiH